MREPGRATRQQTEVIASPLPEFVVSASAGAGKTYVLVQRYLRHVVEERLSPDEILTVTFTKKAAAEMKRRIVAALRELGRLDAAQVAETGPIQTIHSFCERVLKENALEAGLDPGFKIMVGPDQRQCLAACVREAIVDVSGEDRPASRLVAKLAGKSSGWQLNGPYQALEEAVFGIVDRWRGAGTDPDKLLEQHRDPDRLLAAWALVVEKHGSAKLRKSVASRDTKGADAEAAQDACGLVDLACETWWRLERDMDGRQALDFTELERRAVRLLQSSPTVTERLQRQYRVVMVDEAQDLNPQQYALLTRLKPGHRMLVGDEQQSIYGFRDADLNLFRTRSSLVPNLRLDQNHRSSPGILAFVDLLFGRLWPETYRPMAPSEFDLDTVQAPSYDGVEFWNYDVQDGAAVARTLRQLLDEGVRPKDIAVLTRTGRRAIDLRNALEHAGIPARVAGGSERFYTRQEVRDLANCLQAAARPTDDFALLACLRSPLAGLSLDSIVLLASKPGVASRLSGFDPPLPEDRAKLEAFLVWFGPLEAYADRLPAWEVLAEVLAASPYLANLAKTRRSAQVLANVRKLLTLASKKPELGPLEFAAAIRDVQQLRHQEGDAPAGQDDDDEVSLMTIHKAKGLEFPVVVVPETDKKLRFPASDILCDVELGLVAPKLEAAESAIYSVVKARDAERERQEQLRGLYVALTRARQRLCLCLYSRATSESASALIAKQLGDSPPGVRVRDERRQTGP